MSRRSQHCIARILVAVSLICGLLVLEAGPLAPQCAIRQTDRTVCAYAKLLD